MMIVTVLWEDQRGVESKGFGPGDLLVSCVADDLKCDRTKLVGVIESHPKKGNANVRKALQCDGNRLANSGPVFAVIDHDKIRQLWQRPGPMPPNCIPGIVQRFRQDARSSYDLILLVHNVETLIGAVCKALGQAQPHGKPKP